MKIPIEGTCAECPAWHPYSDELKGKGQCRHKFPAYDPDRSYGAFPTTNLHDWCYPGRLLIQEMREGADTEVDAQNEPDSLSWLNILDAVEYIKGHMPEIAAGMNALAQNLHTCAQPKEKATGQGGSTED